MAVKETIQIGDSRLKMKNKIIKNFQGKKTRSLICNLRDTMRKNGLVGMAAPQLGENYQVFVTEPRKTKTRKASQVDVFRVYVNPKIVKSSKQKNLIYEGCGSVLNGELFGPVIRPKQVAIEAYDEKGEKFRLKCDGILARVIQHEYDHLHGIEFTEKISDYTKLMAREFYVRFVKGDKKLAKAVKITVKEYKKID